MAEHQACRHEAFPTLLHKQQGWKAQPGLRVSWPGALAAEPLLDLPQLPGRKSHWGWRRHGHSSCRSSVTKRVESLAQGD